MSNTARHEIPGAGDDGKVQIYEESTNSWVLGTPAGGGGGSMTAAAILAALLTVDGAGSGLDADLLDGQSSAAFLTVAAAPELIRDTIGAALVAGSNVTVTPNDAGDTITIAASGGGSGAVIARQDTKPATNGTVDLWWETDAASFWVYDAGATDFIEVGGAMTAAAILAALLTVDGPGSGLNADLLDGLSSADFVTTAAAPELIRDTMGTALVQGSGITITVNDPGDTITIAASGGGGSVAGGADHLALTSIGVS